MTLLRLALATGVLLAPGTLVARALGLRSVAATLAWSLAVLFGAMAVTFAAGASLRLTLLLVLAVGLAAIPFVRRAPRPERVPGRAWALVAGALLGIALWYVAGEIGGDGLFHLARVRKLEAFDSLSLDAVNEFADGGLHPGYAFPLWHGFLALVAKVSFLDPSAVVLHEASVLAPLAVVVAYEAGYALFRSVGPAVGVACAQVAIAALAPGHGGAYTALGLPATASRQLLVPAALALAFAYVRAPGRALLASTAAAGLVVAVVHPTYALFLWIPFAGFFVLRALVAREDAKPVAAALAALVVPAAAFLAWLLPVVRDTASVSPAAAETRRAIAHYAEQLDLVSDTRYRLAPEVFGRAGAVAVAALLLLPLAGLALRRRWAAFALGGALAVFAVTLVAALFVPFSELVSLSQSRRAAGFWPLAFAFAGGLAVLTAVLRFFVLPLALLAGVALQLAYPGDFAYRLEHGGPALVTWIAVAGAVAAVALGLVRRRPPIDAPGTLAGVAAALFVFPVVVHAAWNWSPSDARRPSPLTSGLVDALRDDVPEGAVVYSDLETSYRIGAFAPVYVVNGPPGHVADTEENEPYERREEARRFFRTLNFSIPLRRGAGWLVVDTDRFALPPARGSTMLLSQVYADERYELYRLGRP